MHAAANANLIFDDGSVNGMVNDNNGGGWSEWLGQFNHICNYSAGIGEEEFSP